MDTITITREQFDAIVKKCNNYFVRIVGAKDKTATEKLATTIMTTQNTAFCSMVAYELFKEKEGN